MFVFLKALYVHLFTSAVQIVERAQTVFRHLKVAYYSFSETQLRALRNSL